MKPELEDILKHYGVKGMKWRQTKDREEVKEEEQGSGGEGDIGENVDEFLDGAKDIAKKVGKKLSKLDDVMLKYGKKGLAGLKDKFYDVQEAHYNRVNTKNAYKDLNVVLKNGGKVPKGYKLSKAKVSKRQVEQINKYLKAVDKNLAKQAAKSKKIEADRRKTKILSNKGLDR